MTVASFHFYTSLRASNVACILLSRLILSRFRLTLSAIASIFLLLSSMHFSRQVTISDWSCELNIYLTVSSSAWIRFLAVLTSCVWCLSLSSRA